MSIGLPVTERRNHPRRLEDRAVDDLLKTCSACYCHSCLDRMINAVLLLDSESQLIYATPQVDHILKRHSLAFSLSPKFTIHHPCYAAFFATFINEKNQQTGPLNLLLEGENGGDSSLLLICFQLPKPAEPNSQIARYMITLRDSNHYPSRQWLLFNKQFNLTPTEARLCSAFVDGLTLNDYCEKWNVASSTARSQLHSIFGKTSTHRQSDLLRLIFLFTRT